MPYSSLVFFWLHSAICTSVLHPFPGVTCLRPLNDMIILYMLCNSTLYTAAKQMGDACCAEETFLIPQHVSYRLPKVYDLLQANLQFSLLQLSLL